MWYVIYGLILYFVVVGLAFGFLWCTRTLGRRYQRRQDAEEYARNIKAYMDEIEGRP